MVIGLKDNKGVIIQKFLRQEVTNLYKRIIDNLNKQLQWEDLIVKLLVKILKNVPKF